MKIRISKTTEFDPEKFIRRCGYGRLASHTSRDVSYIKRVHRDWYPRFHVYILDEKDTWVFNLHLDQRATRYEGVVAHSGEYDSEVVKQEADRIDKMSKMCYNEEVCSGRSLVDFS